MRIGPTESYMMIRAGYRLPFLTVISTIQAEEIQFKRQSMGLWLPMRGMVFTNPDVMQLKNTTCS